MVVRRRLTQSTLKTSHVGFVQVVVALKIGVVTLRCASRKDAAEQPDFGTYHRCTSGGSSKARDKVKVLFMEAFRDLPFSREEKLKILDVGCGLGFISCVCAEFYPKAIVTAIDTFKHASLKGSSLEKARNNAKILGFSDRINFEQRDIFDSDYGKGNFELFVSNLVFHNFGKQRFDAYGRLAQWAAPKSYVILGDLFFDYKSDLRWLSVHFANVKERPTSTINWQYKMLVMSERKKT